MPTKQDWATSIVRAQVESIVIHSLPDRPNLYTAISHANGGSNYLLRVKDGFATCTCLGFTHRGYCKHAAALYLLKPDEILLEGLNDNTTDVT